MLRSAAPGLQGAKEQRHVPKRRKQGDATGQSGTGPQALSDKLEMTGSVYTWLTEGEETNQQEVFVIRPGKLTQLKNARKDGARTKGGKHAIMAALVLVGAQGGARWETWVGENHGMNADETMDHNGPSAGDNGAGN